MLMRQKVKQRFGYITPISKNVVGENGEWQLSNGDCTTERNCGLHIWYAKIMSSLRAAVRTANWPRLNMAVHQTFRNIAFHCPFTNA